MLDKIEFLIGESLKAFRRNGWMAFAAISTVAISMFLMGGLSYAYYALSHYAQDQFPTQFTMDVFLKDGTTTDQIQQTAIQIRAIDGVNHVVLIPKEKAYPKLLKEYGLPAPTEEEGIPIQDKFQVTLNDVSEENSAMVGSQIQKLPTVADQGVKYLVAEQRFIDQVLSLLRLLGSLVGGLLFVTAGILIYNAIRLTIVSRRLEIRVMQLVGASRITIQIPFLFEGIIQGAVGGTLSGFILLASYKLLDAALSGFDAFGSLPYFPVWPAVGMLAVIGALYGFLSSWLALSSPLRYR